MNKQTKSFATLAGILFLGILAIGLIYLFSPKSPAYFTNERESLALIKDPSAVVGVEEVAGKLLIDLRPANVYAAGHPAGAINLPMRRLLDPESVSILRELKKNHREAVVFGNDELQGTAPWLLLRQLGYSNLKLLKGGCSPAGQLIPTPEAGTEKSALDTSLLHQKNQPQTVEASGPEKAKPVIPVRRPASAGGGC